MGMGLPTSSAKQPSGTAALQQNLAQALDASCTLAALIELLARDAELRQVVRAAICRAAALPWPRRIPRPSLRPEAAQASLPAAPRTLVPASFDPSSTQRAEQAAALPADYDDSELRAARLLAAAEVVAEPTWEDVQALALAKLAEHRRS